MRNAARAFAAIASAVVLLAVFTAGLTGCDDPDRPLGSSLHRGGHSQSWYAPARDNSEDAPEHRPSENPPPPKTSDPAIP